MRIRKIPHFFQLCLREITQCRLTIDWAAIYRTHSPQRQSAHTGTEYEGKNQT